MAKGSSTNADYPALVRLLGSMTGDWRATRKDPLDYLRLKVGEDTDAVVADLDALVAAASSEFHYVQVVIESGAHYSPYGDYRTAAEFVERLRERLTSPEPEAGPPEPAEAEEPAGEEPADEFALVRRVLRALWSGWRDASDDVDVVEYLGMEVRDLVDVAGVEPAAVVAEIDHLLTAGWSAAEHARFLAEAGAYDARYRDVEEFWRDLRDHVADLAEQYPRPELDPAAVTAATLAAMDAGEFGRAMTGLVRRYAIPALRTGDLAHFRATVGALLDRVLPQWVQRYVDDLCYSAQCVADDADWTRVRWMRSAVELLLTEYAETDAAVFVDVDQVSLVDGLLAAPTARFRQVAGATSPQLPDSHWWWAEQTGDAGRVGLPTQLRWYRGWGAWQARPSTRAADGTRAEQAAELSGRMVRAGLVGFTSLLEPAWAAATVEVLDDDGRSCWAARSLPARVLGEQLVVDDTQLARAPSGQRVITSATVRGAVEGVGAAWSAELVRDRAGTPSWGWTTLVVDGSLPSSADAALGGAVQTWEDELGVAVTDWVSAASPALIGRYGWGRETFAHDLPRPHPLLTGISTNLWDGDLLPALAGLTRVYAGKVFDDVDRRPWETDWIAALQYLGADGWDEFVVRLVHWTRSLTDDDWYLLCAARSGIQLLADELGQRLPGYLRAGRVRTLDVAMRTFGHPFGPVPLTSVPARLHRVHKWWRFPAGTPGADKSVSLTDLAVELRAELDRQDGERTSGARTAELQRILRGCDRVLDGTSPGFDEDDARLAAGIVGDSWSHSGDLGNQVLAYFQPIAHHTPLWPLPAEHPPGLA